MYEKYFRARLKFLHTQKNSVNTYVGFVPNSLRLPKIYLTCLSDAFSLRNDFLSSRGTHRRFKICRLKFWTRHDFSGLIHKQKI